MSAANHTHPARRTVVAAVLATLMACASFALPGSPAGAEPDATVPNHPTILLAMTFTDAIHVYWGPPNDDGASPITSYKVTRSVLDKKTDTYKKDKVFTQSDTRPLVDSSAAAGEKYHYKVRAVNGYGTSDASSKAWGELHPNRTPYTKFGNHPANFVKRQYQDFLGRNPGIGELSTWTLSLKNGTVSPEDLINHVAAEPNRVQLRQPLIRLYFAYFGRSPDHGGLNYWVARRQEGKNLDVVSSNFAASSEFQNTYGSLNNTEFVTLVYKNVLKRDPDPAGLAYWTKQLDTNGAKRGRVMTQFSESTEYKAASRGLVLAADVYDETLGHPGTKWQVANHGAHVQGGGSAGSVATVVISLNNEYV